MVDGRFTLFMALFDFNPQPFSLVFLPPPLFAWLDTHGAIY